jgi:hypothetical protein
MIFAVSQNTEEDLMKTWRQKWDGWKVATSDGCTSSPDLNFRECCEEHDFYYQKHEKDTGVSRREADKRLRQCIQRKWCMRFSFFGRPVTIKAFFLPWTYWVGVRVFGWKFWRD